MDSPETIQKIIDLAPPTEIEYEGRTYTSKPVHLLLPPLAAAVPVSTLQGLVDLYEADLSTVSSEKVLAHITSPTSVQLVSKDVDQWERYRVFAEATYPKACQQFPYGKFLKPEEFIILAQVCFQRVKIENDDGSMEKDLDYVLKIASAISAGKEQTNADDGISQTVQMKAGVTLKTTETLRPIVNLAPYRTFAEIDQVVSRFIFRAHGDEEGAELALFEADGGRWRLGAVAAISTWLKAKFGTSVPVIS